MLKRYQKATSAFQKALTFKSNKNYFNALGFAFSKSREYDKALNAYNKSISLDNKNSFAYYNAGLLLELKGESIKAGKYFYSAGSSSLIEKNYDRLNDSFQALKRLSQNNITLRQKFKKLNKNIKVFFKPIKEGIKLTETK